MYQSNCGNGCGSGCGYSGGGTTSLDSSIQHQANGKTVNEDYLASSKYDSNKGDDIMSKDYQKLEKQGSPLKEKSHAQEEIFGPVLCIIPYENEEEAIEIANDTIFGLSNGVAGANMNRAMDVASRLRSGQVHVNSIQQSLLAPFGGYKQSGDGREWGKEK